MEKQKLVSVVIVNYNGAHFLRQLIPNLKNIDYKNIEYIFVDNNSNDDSVSYLNQIGPLGIKTQIILNNQNLGFAQGNNCALNKLSGEYILLLNNDTQVKSDFINFLVNRFESDPNLGCVQSKILRLQNPNQLDSVGAFYTKTGFLYHHGYLHHNDNAYNKTNFLYSAKGACIMLKTSLVNKIGLFDNDFKSYFEESDLCLRIWGSGHTVAYEPKSIIYHHIGGTSNNMDSYFIQFHSYKNRICSYLKNLELNELATLLPIHLLLINIICISYLVKGKLKLALALQLAIYWNIVNFYKTIKKRKLFSKNKKTTYKYISSKLCVNPGLSYFTKLLKNDIEHFDDSAIINNVIAASNF